MNHWRLENELVYNFYSKEFDALIYSFIYLSLQLKEGIGIY